MNRSLHPTRNFGRLYLARKEGGSGLTSYEECVKVEVEDPDAFKKRLKEEKTSQWLEKPLHGRFTKDTEKMSAEKNVAMVVGGTS